MAKFCHECGNPIVDSNMPFCPKCGAKLSVTLATPQPTHNQNESPKPELQKPTGFTKKLLEFWGLKENKDTGNFEFRTGIGIIDNCFDPVNFERKNQPLKSINPQLNVIAGVIIILALYIFPITSFQGRNLSVADFNTVCSNIIGIAFGGSNCDIWNTFFYGGWLIGIICILWGVVEYLKEK